MVRLMALCLAIQKLPFHLSICCKSFEKESGECQAVSRKDILGQQFFKIGKVNKKIEGM